LLKIGESFVQGNRDATKFLGNDRRRTQMRLGIKGVITAAMLAALLASNVFAADNAQDIYKAKCQMCHGPNGQPTAVGKSMGARPFSDPDVVKMSDAELASITSTGKNKMPAYKGKVSEDQITALVKYVRGLK
jgi:cytochrome c6